MDKERSKWETAFPKNSDVNYLESKLLKQYWESFCSSPGDVLQLVRLYFVAPWALCRVARSLEIFSRTCFSL